MWNFERFPIQSTSPVHKFSPRNTLGQCWISLLCWSFSTIYKCYQLLWQADWLTGRWNRVKFKIIYQIKYSTFLGIWQRYSVIIAIPMHFSCIKPILRRVWRYINFRCHYWGQSLLLYITLKTFLNQQFQNVLISSNLITYVATYVLI